MTDQPSTAVSTGRFLIAIYALFALAATARSGVQLLTKADEAPLAYGLSGFAAVVYIVATLGFAEVVPWARRVAWTAVLIELIGVTSVGMLSFLKPEWFPEPTVWSGFGWGYGALPLVLPLAGIAWLNATQQSDGQSDGQSEGQSTRRSDGQSERPT